MKPQQEEIDRLMRQRLLEADQSGGEWDLPSEQVWTSVERRIREKHRDRGAMLWIFGGLLILAVGVFLLIQHRQPDTAIDLRITDTSPSTLVDKEEYQHTQSSHSGSDADASISHSLQNQESTPQSGPSSKISSLSSDLPGTVQARHNGVSIPAQEDPGKHIRKNSDRGTASKLSDIGAQSATDPEQISPERATNSFSPAVENSTVHENPSERLHTPVANAHVSLLHTDLFVITTEKNMLPAGDVLPMISRSKQSSWSVTASISPSLGTRRILVPSAQPLVRRDLLLQQEEPAVQAGFSVSAMHAFTPRWSVEGGLKYSRFLLRSSSTQQIRYSRIGETQNARGNYENRFRLNLNTSYGDVSTDVVVERSSDSQFEEHQFINLSVQTRQSMQVLQFPVSMRYHIPAGTWSVSCYGGLAANVLLENAFEIQAVASLDSEVVQTRAMRNAALSGYQDFALGYQFGIGIEIPLHRQLSLLAGPSVSGYLQPVYENRHVVIYPTMFEMQAGIRYRL